MSLSVIDVLFLVLAYYAMRMTTIKDTNFILTAIWMLRASAVLMLISVAIGDKYYIIGSKQIPIIGMVGFLFYGIALGIVSLRTESLIRSNETSFKYSPAYTWDMVVIGILATFWIIILIATQ